MYTSVKWLNDYLDPPASAEEQADLLTKAGFPLEGREDLDGDVRQDFEMTSNRGDCVCHVGLAREIAAISGRTLKTPAAEPTASGPPVEQFITVTNHDTRACPLYTGRVIRGVTVGPSPDWLADRIRARGDLPRNNVVDLTNFVLFELGQPTHVFDLSRLLGEQIIIRFAHDAEPFLPIGEGAQSIKLSPDDLVIADAERPVAMAGVKGGAETAVTENTTDILIEAATFDPVCVRNTSRRHNIASDSSYRFERGVHPAQVNHAADRLAALILDLCGGELCEGVASDGEPIPPPIKVNMRPDRGRQILGVDVSNEQMTDSLNRLGFAPQHHDGLIECTVPVHRQDIDREVDLIEEVGRMIGYDTIEIADKIDIRVAPPQPQEMARRAVSDVLVGLGFFETITHSLTSEKHAALFIPPEMRALNVDEQRAAAEPTLRPSIIPSLLEVYQRNRDHGVVDVKLFEHAAVFGEFEQGTGDSHIENFNLAMLHPAGDADNPLRYTRGVIERLVKLLRGRDADVEIEPSDYLPWFEPGAVVRYGEGVLGVYGMLAPHIMDAFGLKGSLCAAELGLPSLYENYPPIVEAEALPAFPAIERDLSLILDEHTRWDAVRDAVSALTLDYLEAIDFVTVFRGKQIPKGKKSLTLRLRFRAPDHTLKHEDVNPQMDKTVSQVKKELNAEIRA